MIVQVCQWPDLSIHLTGQQKRMVVILHPDREGNLGTPNLEPLVKATSPGDFRFPAVATLDASYAAKAKHHDRIFFAACE